MNSVTGLSCPFKATISKDLPVEHNLHECSYDEPLPYKIIVRSIQVNFGLVAFPVLYL